MSPIEIFISHSHNDEDLVNILVKAINNNLYIPENAIRCSSLSGYKLDLGALPAEQLRVELKSAKLIIALITPYSQKSNWVLFELGASWGLGCNVIPLLVGGVGNQDLPGPLKETIGGQLSDLGILTQLMKQIGDQLGWKGKGLQGIETINELVLYAKEKKYFSEEVSSKQMEILQFIINESKITQTVRQDKISHKFNGTEGIYYRLEQLRLLGFIEKT